MGEKKVFQFSSGGRHHPSGFGEWVFTLDGDGSLHAEHHVGEQKKHDKAHALSKDDAMTCWACIEAAVLPSIKGSDRPGLPDEPRYRFTLEGTAGKADVQVWANDVAGRPDLKKLVALVKDLLQKYTKKGVVI